MVVDRRILEGVISREEGINSLPPVNLIYYSCATLVLIGGLVWKLSASISALKTSVHIIETNHLKHIEDDIREVKEFLKILLTNAIKLKED